MAALFSFRTREEFRERGKNMEQRKSYQLYLLEGELERVEFEYQNAYRAEESAKERIGDYKFYLRMSAVYAFMTVMFLFGGNIISFIAGGISLVYLVAPILFLFSLISTAFWLGTIWKFIRFGFSLKKLQKKKEESEVELFSASQKLNNLQLQIENLKTELAVEEKEKRKEEPELTEADEQENLLRKKETLDYRIDRLEKTYHETEAELHRMLKEEFENEREKKRYGKLTIAGLVLAVFLLFLQAMDIMIFTTVASRVIIMLMPWCILIPYSIAWLSKAMNTFWGEKLWINQFIFKEIHEYSLAERIRKNREELRQLKENIAELKKQKEEIADKLAAFSI